MTIDRDALLALAEKFPIGAEVEHINDNERGVVIGNDDHAVMVRFVAVSARWVKPQFLRLVPPASTYPELWCNRYPDGYNASWSIVPSPPGPDCLSVLHQLPSGEIVVEQP